MYKIYIPTRLTYDLNEAHQYDSQIKSRANYFTDGTKINCATGVGSHGADQAMDERLIVFEHIHNSFSSRDLCSVLVRAREIVNSGQKESRFT